jgi:hypothetical protein
MSLKQALILAFSQWEKEESRTWKDVPVLSLGDRIEVRGQDSWQ